MGQRLKDLGAKLADWWGERMRSARYLGGRGIESARRSRTSLIVLAILIGAGYLGYRKPPVTTIPHGEVGVRVNQLTGSAQEVREGTAWLVPGVQSLRRISLVDQTYRPGSGGANYQSVEGLTFGVDVAVRYAVDPTQIVALARNLPTDISGQVVGPEVDGVVYKIFARYTVREIYSSKRSEIQDAITEELRGHLSHDGLLLRSVQIGKVDLPEDYRRGLENLLAEELASEKMRFTLELKEKQVKQTELEAEAAKVRSDLQAQASKTSREMAAEAQAREQIIAAQAQEESMKHVLPFKQKQIEQRQLEAEADKQSRIRTAEGAAQARVIEASAEADSRRKLADAEVYRMEQVGKTTSAQMEREGELISKHPLLIQKTLADKLSDKISVIIAPAPSGGGFIGSNLLGHELSEKTNLNAQIGGQP
jgi:regulator of protease activity HflC (stomatin/prohibitin superfamily)